ncbi:phosphonatase-like hydrolase [Pseudonocardia spinosispora]|uniref:phosphonatase-like hydrolase n=1 Tax=Pseudonocardia spinosispora TaxID=103441 RepID=UPI0003F51D79|nr:phosphonatase-like hydrolase [Pseudonocardia spinosispora]
MIRLVCLDMAGTTVEDSGTVLAAFDAALSDAGFDAGSAEYAAGRRYAVETMGQSKIEVFRAILGGDEARAQQANSAFEAAYAESIDAVRPVPGAAEVIEKLRSAGRRVVLTTGFSPATRDRILDVLGWRELVPLALSPVDAGRGRPYPDMVLTALLRTGTTSVQEVATVGDTTSDLLSGHRAGCAVIAGVLTGAHTASDFATVPHTHVLDSVADLPEALERQDLTVTGARS